jgi:TatD DNase family protein
VAKSSAQRQRRDDQSRPPAPEPLPAEVTDTHCHLDLARRWSPADAQSPTSSAEAGDPGDPGPEWTPEQAVASAAAVGVSRIVQIGCDLESARWSVEVAATLPGIVAGVALHPNEAPALQAAGRLDEALAVIESLAAAPATRAVGETGLDFFRTGPEGIAAQQTSFAAHIAMAKRHDRTLVIHDRDAHDALLDVLDGEGLPDRVVMHCFSGDPEFARKCLDRGAYLSFAGVVTFRNAASLRAALAVTPLDRLLVETDAPYLTPHPYRGRPNSSYLIPLTVRAMAQARGDDLAMLCQVLRTNAAAAFGGDWASAPTGIADPG